MAAHGNAYASGTNREVDAQLRCLRPVRQTIDNRPQCCALIGRKQRGYVELKEKLRTAAMPPERDGNDDDSGVEYRSMPSGWAAYSYGKKT